MKQYSKITLLVGSFIAIFAPLIAQAHCPLCTAGAVALGLGAYQLGISTVAVGIGIGAFSIALGLWIARLIAKKYIPLQDEIVALFFFITTVWPIIGRMPGYTSIYIPSIGEYGSTYMISLFLLGSIAGGTLMYISPLVSTRVTRIVGKRIPYQGLLITFVLLLGAVLFSEFVL